MEIFNKLVSHFEYDEQQMSKPTQGVVSITNRCNLSCPYCFHKQGPEDMTIKTMEDVVKFLLSNAAQTGVKPGITFFGGEPLLCFKTIIKPIVEKYHNAFNWSITTNGTLLTEEIIDFFVKYNVSVLLSIDGCKQVQDLQRPLKENGSSSYEKLRNIIPYLLLKKPNVVYRATITRHSLKYLQETIKDIEVFGFRYVTFIPNLFEEWSYEDYYLWEQFIDLESIKIIKNVTQDTPFSYILTNLIDGVKFIIDQNKHNELINPLHRCGMGCHGIGIATNGDLHPCQEENGYIDKFIIGNIYHGIEIEKHKQYCQNMYNSWLQYLENIESIASSNNFKLFYAESYCPTRLKDNLAFNKTQEFYLRVLHRACSRLYFNFYLTLNPYANFIFPTEERSCNNC